MNNKTIIALRSFIVAVGATAASAFVGVYGAFLGASPAEMGWLQSAANSVGNGAQLFWGRMSDRFGVRKFFLVVGGAVLALLWFLMGVVKTPVELIIAYGGISFFGSMITVNWFSLIAEQAESSSRGKFLSIVNNLASVGTIISLLLMSIFFTGKVTNEIRIPFFVAALSYLISVIVVALIKEKKHSSVSKKSLLETMRTLRGEKLFYRYFLAMNIQGYFWSMAWPLFPLTIVDLMHFNLSEIAYLTVAASATTVLFQFLIGRITDKINRHPLIFLNRLMLSLIPIFYAFFHNFQEFIILELYSGGLSAIQNVVMNSYLLDIIPVDRRGEFISILNGFNGLVYLFGALSGGYLLQAFISFMPLGISLTIAYLIIFSGRFLSSFLFYRLKESQDRGAGPLSLFQLILRQKPAGSPSGGTIKVR